MNATSHAVEGIIDYELSVEELGLTLYFTVGYLAQPGRRDRPTDRNSEFLWLCPAGSRADHGNGNLAESLRCLWSKGDSPDTR